MISLDNSDIFGTRSLLVNASILPDSKGLVLELKRIWATCSSTTDAFSSITKISSNPSEKLFISSSMSGQGTLHAKSPIPLFSGSVIPILSSASIVSVVALPTAIIPSFFFLG